MQEQLTALTKSSSFPIAPSNYWSIDRARKAGLRAMSNGDSVVLYGPPGTGKTRLAAELVDELGKGNPVVHEEIQFHQKFSYEDFLEGFRPDGKGGFMLADGVFKAFCNRARADKTNSIFVFGIDEFNRAELSTTLGEVLYLMEDRAHRTAKLAHSGEKFTLPENVLILGTMNTADKTIAIIDFALRRRFRFVPVWPDYRVMREWLNTKDWRPANLSIDAYCKAAFVLNQRISNHQFMNKHMQLGHAMFVPKQQKIDETEVGDVFRFTILPQLETYCGFGREDELKGILNSAIGQKLRLGQEIADGDIIGMLAGLSVDAVAKGTFV